jgi:hypothetical protein
MPYAVEIRNARRIRRYCAWAIAALRELEESMQLEDEGVMEWDWSDPVSTSLIVTDHMSMISQIANQVRDELADGVILPPD